MASDIFAPSSRDLAAPSSKAAFGRVWTEDKIVPDRLLNRLGCQALRAATARFLLIRRRNRHAMSDIARTFLRDGLLVVENFLPESTFEKISAEVEARAESFLPPAPEPDKFGLVRRQFGIHKRLDDFPVARDELYRHPALNELAAIAEGWPQGTPMGPKNSVFKFEVITMPGAPSAVTTIRDPEISSGDPHADTFHSVTKFFYTLTDVTPETAPFYYAVGSQRLTMRRMHWEYKNSTAANQYDGSGYHNRLAPEDQSRMRFELRPVIAPRNTLIATDVYGFHCRGAMTQQGAVRKMLRFDLRSSPFS